MKIVANFKIEHVRPDCIACGACAAVTPDFWEMSPADGKSDIKGAERIMNGSEIIVEKLSIEEKDFQANKDAADACPVNVIHIFKESGEKII